jgi:hypothetical protein
MAYQGTESKLSQPEIGSRRDLPDKPPRELLDDLPRLRAIESNGLQNTSSLQILARGILRLDVARSGSLMRKEPESGADVAGETEKDFPNLIRSMSHLLQRESQANYSTVSQNWGKSMQNSREKSVDLHLSQ